MTTKLEAGPGGTRMIIARAETLIEEGIEWRRKEDRGVARKGTNVKLSKSKCMNLPSKLEM